MTVDAAWRSLPLPMLELSLARVLRCGQTFRWKNINNVWTFTTLDRVILLQQDEQRLKYASLGPGRADPAADVAFLEDYFTLHVKLGELYSKWAAVEAKHKKLALFVQFPGIRMLRQEPWETVVLFICSSNNNVKRILKMVDALCQGFGTHIADFEGHPHYSFPGPEKLAHPDTEARLRELGFGYRARFIQQTAQMFMDEAVPEITLEKLYALRDKPYQETHDFLLQLLGVGPKVADCICLMALDKHNVVPVDTHVMQIAVRDYKYRGAKTQKAYHLVREHLQNLFGEYAGWAQLVMFAADLSDLNNGVNTVGGEHVKHEVKTEATTVVKVESTTVVKAEAAASGTVTVAERKTVRRDVLDVLPERRDKRRRIKLES